MKKTGMVLLILAALVFGSGIAVFAQTSQSIAISATLDHGVSLPGTNTILKCPGTMLSTDNPFVVCAPSSTISFGTLRHTLPDGSQAGVFYAPDFFMVFLFPTAWGGAGYTLQQTFSWDQPFQAESLVFTPVYSKDDRLSSTSPIQDTIPQGATLGSVGPATGGSHLIYDSGKPGLNRIVRALYGLPPNPNPNDPDPTKRVKPFSTWVGVPLTQGAGPYSGTLIISITEK